MFPQNAEHQHYSDLLLEFFKAFANKIDIYPKNIEDIIDIMRKVPPKKSKPKAPKEKGREKETELATSLAPKDKAKSKDGEYRCYCCGRPDCRLWCCGKKETLATKDWHKPSYAKSNNKSGDKKVRWGK